MLAREGKLTGDLNIAQRYGLLWLMNSEVGESLDMEIVRFKHHALATNPGTSKKYIEDLFVEQHKEAPPSEPAPDSDEWFTPETPQDIEEVLSRLGKN